MNTTLPENIEFIRKTGSLRGGSARFTIELVFWMSSVSTKNRKWNSTPVENVRQIRLFMQNEPKFSHFSPENEDLTKKRTQTKPILAQNQASIKKTNPISKVFTGLDINLPNCYIRFSSIILYV
jgi:hypothetical protein